MPCQGNELTQPLSEANKIAYLENSSKSNSIYWGHLYQQPSNFPDYILPIKKINYLIRGIIQITKLSVHSSQQKKKKEKQKRIELKIYIYLLNSCKASCFLGYKKRKN